jgi:hypothetical protein
MVPAIVGARSVGPGDGAATADTLVVGPDGHYGERARSALAELGSVACALARPDDALDVAWLVEQARPNVVVLDATGCEAAVARVIATLSEKEPRLGVVVVCEHLTVAARELQALPKWGWTRELRSAVQRAQIDGSPLVRPSALWTADRRDLRGVARRSAARR